MSEPLPLALEPECLQHLLSGHGMLVLGALSGFMTLWKGEVVGEPESGQLEPGSRVGGGQGEWGPR